MSEIGSSESCQLFAQLRQRRGEGGNALLTWSIAPGGALAASASLPSLAEALAISPSSSAASLPSWAFFAAMSSVAYTDPGVARVGLTEDLGHAPKASRSKRAFSHERPEAV